MVPKKKKKNCVCLRLQPGSPKLMNGVMGAMTFCCGTELLAEPVAMLVPNEAQEDSLHFFVLIVRELACGRHSVGQAVGLEDPSVWLRTRWYFPEQAPSEGRHILSGQTRTDKTPH